MSGELDFSIRLEVEQLRADVRKVQSEFAKLGNKAEAEGARIDNTFKRVGGLIAGYFGAQELISFGKSIVNVRAEFEKFGIVLENTLGSQIEADNALNMVAEFASKTPFQLNELSDAFIKLTNQGFQPTYEEMTKLGDLASSTGKGFGQLSEAIIDAQTGEFERLKEFGVKASKAGDQITFSFKGQQTVVKDTAQSIREYILGLGSMEGVVGANAKISASLTGKISNLADAWDAMLNKIGQGNQGAITGALDSAKFLVDNYEEVAKVLGVLIATYGAYKAALIAATVAQKAKQLVDNIQLIMMFRKELGLATAAQQAFNVTAKANPYVLFATVIIGVISALTLFGEKSEEVAEKTRTLKDMSDEFTSSLAQETSGMNNLFGQLSKTNIGTETRAALIKEINSKYGEYLPYLLTEKSTLNEIKIAQDEANKALINNIALKAQNTERTRILEAQIKREQETFKKLADSQKVNVSVITAAYNDYLNSSSDGSGQFGDFSSFFAISDAFKNVSSEEVRAISDLTNARIRDGKELQAITDLYSGYITKVKESSNTNGTQGASKDKNDPIKDLLKFLDEQKSAYEKYNQDISGLTGERLKMVDKEYEYLTQQGKDYLEFLNNQLATEKDLKKQAVLKKEIETVSFDLMVNEQQNAQKIFEKNKEDLEKLLELYATYTSKKEGIEKRYFDEITKLRSLNKEAEAKEAEKALQNELESLDESVLQSNRAFKQWIEGDLPLIVKNGKKAIYNELSKLVLKIDTETGLDPEQVIVYKAQIKKLQDELDKLNDIGSDININWKDSLEIMNGINSLANDLISSFDGIDDGTKNIIKNITNIAGGILNIGVALDAFKTAVTSLEKASAIMAAISAGIKIVSAVVDLVKRNNEAENENQRALDEITQRKIDHQTEYNRLLREQNLLMENATSIFGEEGIAKAANSVRVYFDVMSEYKEKIKALNNLGIVTGSETVSTGFLGLGKKQQDVYSQILKVYPDLINAEGTLNVARAQSILSIEKMNDADRKTIEGLVALDAEAKKAQESLNSYLSATYGSLGDDLMSSLEESIRTGADAWEIFGDAGTKVIENLGKQLTYQLFFAESFKSLQEQLSKTYSSGKSDEEIANDAATVIENFYNGIGAQMDNAKDFMEQWDANIQSFDLWQGEDAAVDKTREASSKGFATMSQNSADELNGRFTTIQGHTYEINNNVKLLTENSGRVLDLLGGIQTNTRRLEAIETDMRSVKTGIDIINTKGITIKQ